MTCELKPCVTLPKPTNLPAELKQYPSIGSNPISEIKPLITSCDGCVVNKQLLSTKQDVPPRVVTISVEPTC
jgi:hypothetical protein